MKYTFKQIVAAASITILIVVGLWCFTCNREIGPEMKALRVSFPSSRPVNQYDPVKIEYLWDAQLVAALYSPLIERDLRSDLVSGVAKSFEWVGNSAHLTIRDDLFTAGGQQITPEDVVFSLKRAMILKSNSHADLDLFLCAGQKLKAIDDTCDDIEIQGQKVILHLTERKFFFFKVLSNKDHAIVPRSAVDPVTLQIVDYRNTSGPYYAVSGPTETPVVLKANPHHFSYSERMPQEIILVPGGHDSKKLVSMFENNEIDYIGSFNALTRDDFEFLRERLASTTSFHLTSNISSLFLQITPDGLRRLSVARRLGLAQSMLERSAEIFNRPNSPYSYSESLVPSVGYGSLTNEQQKQAMSIVQSANKDQGAGITIVSHPGAKSQVEEIFATAIPAASIVYSAQYFGVEGEVDPKTEMADYVVMGMDFSPDEEVGGIAYCLKSGMYPIFGEEQKQWLSEYILIEDPAERGIRLRKLHFDALAVNPTIIPINQKSFHNIIRRPWKLEFSNLVSIGFFWQILHD